MKKWMSAAVFVLAINYCALGISGAPKLINRGASAAAIHLKLIVQLPQVTGSAPVGVANGTPVSASISWDSGAPISGVTTAGYNVYRSTTSGGEAGTSAINGTTLVTGTSYTDTAVTAGTTYYYVVAAQASTGNQSGFSNEASGLIPANPSNPTGCSVKGQ